MSRTQDRVIGDRISHEKLIAMAEPEIISMWVKYDYVLFVTYIYSHNCKDYHYVYVNNIRSKLWVEWCVKV